MTGAWNPDFFDLVDVLEQAGVEYVIVGAFALAAHGLPRATGDIDFFVRPSRENAKRVMRALASFGAPLKAAGVSELDFEREGTVYQLGVPPRRIDILNQISGVDFDEALAGHIERVVESRRLRFLGYEALLKNKRASGRPKDLVDVGILEKSAKSRS